MSAAVRAKSARARATIARRLLIRTKTWAEGGYGLGRSFDDCFEMNDGDEVFRLLAERAVHDPELYAAMKRHGQTDWLRQIDEMRESRLQDIDNHEHAMLMSDLIER